MVCLGNICRSPLAHGLLASKLPKDDFFVDSAGTADYHVGDLPDKRSIKVAQEHGIDISQQRGRQFQISDFDKFDHIFVMDDSNYNNVVQLARHQSDRSKVKFILEHDDQDPTSSVPDPYYGDYAGFEATFEVLNKACTVLANHLQNK